MQSSVLDSLRGFADLWAISIHSLKIWAWVSVIEWTGLKVQTWGHQKVEDTEDIMGDVSQRRTSVLRTKRTKGEAV